MDPLITSLPTLTTFHSLSEYWSFQKVGDAGDGYTRRGFIVQEDPVVHILDGASLLEAASVSRGSYSVSNIAPGRSHPLRNNFKVFNEFYLKAKAGIWP